MWPSPAGGINPYVRIIRDDARTSRTTAIDPPKELMREIHLEYARWNYVRNYFRYLPRGACKFYSQSLFSAFVLLSYICLFPRVRYFIRVANLVVFTTFRVIYNPLCDHNASWKNPICSQAFFANRFPEPLRLYLRYGIPDAR